MKEWRVEVRLPGPRWGDTMFTELTDDELEALYQKMVSGFTRANRESFSRASTDPVVRITEDLANIMTEAAFEMDYRDEGRKHECP